MKLWEKEIEIDQTIEKFTIGRDPEFDVLLAPFDVYTNLAHAKMLNQCNLLTDQEYRDLHRELIHILNDIKNQKFEISEGVEDVHSQIEWLLTQKVGDAGKKIHTARSRNDQVLTDLKLFFRHQIEEIVGLAESLIKITLAKAEHDKDKLLPGYTHMQVAMISSFGVWFSAYAESLIDDLELFSKVYDLVNQNPLGSAAGYGSGFPIDRELTTRLLGFRCMHINVQNAQMQRGKSELWMSFGLASLAHTLNKWATDICLYNSQNFDFVRLPDNMTTGSSIMPHKKNPDVFELICGKTNQIVNIPTQITQLINNLPAGYHRDFQLLKEVLFPAFETIKDCLEIFVYAMPLLQTKDHLMENPLYLPAFSVERVNEIIQQGIPFRDAYHQVAKEVELGELKACTVNHTHIGSIGNLALSQIEDKLKTVLAKFDFTVPAKAIDDLLKTI